MSLDKAIEHGQEHRVICRYRKACPYKCRDCGCNWSETVPKRKYRKAMRLDEKITSMEVD